MHRTREWTCTIADGVARPPIQHRYVSIPARSTPQAPHPRQNKTTPFRTSESCYFSPPPAGARQGSNG
ncbi:hypothetical protein HYPSUDRAFT_41196 [Hypholoma sublateritium FD-334 SS-4]|uniref:Uncharacterized protein n=1 Tax=Hypholoma sublateritium (strain FD-334 SS-4) TaxID=945553 RepID=A0A0D2L5C0_HYPSF|nr:hypothetical protein HYPSUDRAFT_41196 [Hypholoma sublateritium FD-334 SS-4]